MFTQQKGLSTTYHRGDITVERLQNSHASTLVFDPAGALHPTVRAPDGMPKNRCLAHHATRRGVRVREVEYRILFL